MQQRKKTTLVLPLIFVYVNYKLQRGQGKTQVYYTRTPSYTALIYVLHPTQPVTAMLLSWCFLSEFHVMRR